MSRDSSSSHSYVDAVHALLGHDGADLDCTHCITRAVKDELWQQQQLATTCMPSLATTERICVAHIAEITHIAQYEQ
jgi:hypothetical protein